MDIKKAEEAKFILKEIEDYKYCLEGIKHHSFGFGTSFHKVDDFLRPQAKFFIESKIIELEKDILEK